MFFDKKIRISKTTHLRSFGAMVGKREDKKMPCNIGYRVYAPIKIPAPVPQEFKSRTEAPKIDAELLDRLGESDPVFCEWLKALDIKPLLQQALERALTKVKITKTLKVQISDAGYLEAQASFIGEAQKAKLEKLSGQVASQFQLEVMKMIAELLDYETAVTEDKNGGWVIEGEKNEQRS